VKVEAAGIASDGSALWLVDSTRRLQWFGSGGDKRGQIDAPVPGVAPVLTADTLTRENIAVVAANGSWWKTVKNPPRWVRHADLAAVPGRPRKETTMGTKEAPALLMAGFARGAGRVAWAISADRVVLVRGEDATSTAPLISQAIPGSEAVMAFDFESRTVLLGDGTLVRWLPSGWARFGSVFGAVERTTRKLQALAAFAVGGGKTVSPGDTFVLGIGPASVLVANNRAVYLD